MMYRKKRGGTEVAENFHAAQSLGIMAMNATESLLFSNFWWFTEYICLEIIPYYPSNKSMKQMKLHPAMLHIAWMIWQSFYTYAKETWCL